MMVIIINVIITTVASKAYDEINPKILKNYLIFTVSLSLNVQLHSFCLDHFFSTFSPFALLKDRSLFLNPFICERNHTSVFV